MCSTTELLWLKGWLVLAISIKKKNKQKKAEEIQDDLFSFQQGTLT